MVECGGTLQFGDGHSIISDELTPNGVIEPCSDWLHEGEKGDEAEQRIRCQTRTGRLSGPPTFLDQLETLLNRIVRPKKRRPQPKQKPKGRTARRVSQSPLKLFWERPDEY